MSFRRLIKTHLRHFIPFSDKKYRKLIHQPSIKQLKDPINIMEDMYQKPRLMEICYQLEKSKEFMPNVISIGSLMYHMGRTHVNNDYVFQRIEDKLVELNGSF
jgi:hypothetical protein